MSRLPFDPDKLPDRAPGPPARREQEKYAGFDEARPLSVSQVTQLLKQVIADRTPSPLRVVGEVSNLSDRKHWFLSLKDETDVLSCVMWASATRKCDFVPERGQQVVATGRLDYYGPQGRLQLYIDKLEPVGQGALELRFRQLCETLRKEGYFEDAHKRAAPAFPQHLAVVTSEGGAALHDVVNTARHRWPGIQISLIDVRVQGEGAAGQIAHAIDWLSRNNQGLGVDAIILTRGGGSLEDLWAFNERVVADAIHRCELFIAAAIGHETDTTIAELVADLRCSTPTQAAARLVPDAEAESHRIGQYAHRLATALRRNVQHARARWEAVARHPMFRRPTETVDRHRQHLAHLEHRLRAALQGRMSDARESLHRARHDLATLNPAGRARLARREVDDAARRLQTTMQQRISADSRQLHALQRQLEAVGPQSVLARGYSYTTDAGGQVIRSVEQVAPGQAVTTHVSDGAFRSEVVDGREDSPAKPPRPAQPEAGATQRPPRRKRNRARPADAAQQQLFDAADDA